MTPLLEYCLSGWQMTILLVLALVGAVYIFGSLVSLTLGLGKVVIDRVA